MAKFKVGDRVTRRTDVFDQKSELLRGVILKVYSQDKYDELYAVQWDGHEFGDERNFLPHGLDPEDLRDAALNAVQNYLISRNWKIRTDIVSRYGIPMLTEPETVGTARETMNISEAFALQLERDALKEAS